MEQRTTTDPERAARAHGRRARGAHRAPRRPHRRRPPGGQGAPRGVRPRRGRRRGLGGHRRRRRRRGRRGLRRSRGRRGGGRGLGARLRVHHAPRRGWAGIAPQPRPPAISATARGSRSCSIGRRRAWTAPGSRRVGQLDRALEDDRARVDPFVDEVDRHAEDLHAVLDGLLDRAHAGEGGQQRGVDVEDPVGEARHEAGVEDRHVAGEHDELDALLDAASRRWRRRARRARRTPSAGRPATGTPAAWARSSARAERLIAGDGDDLDLAAVDAVEQRLEVRALARGEDADPHAAARRRRAAWGRRRRWRPAAPRRAARRRAPAPRRRAGGRTCRRRAARRRRSCARPASARRAGSRPFACARPTARRR